MTVAGTPEFSAGAKPLDAFPVARTGDIDEMRGIVTTYYGDNKVLAETGGKPLRAYANHCQLEDVGISYADYGAAVNVMFPEFASGYSIPIAIAGGGFATTTGPRIDINRHQTVIASKGVALDLHHGLGCKTIAVRLNSTSMRNKVASLVGAVPKDNLVFEPLLDFRRPGNGLWLRLLWFLIGEIDRQEQAMPHVAFAEIEQALLLTFFKANMNSYSHLLAAQVRIGGPWQVRRAEEYIEAHWDQPITVEALALVTNCSVRSVFTAFKQSRGYSPMVFAKQVRLRHAREMLTRPLPQTSVTDVAFACGFGNLGHFAKDYFSLFGELPSETLISSRGVIPANPRAARLSRGH